MSLKQNDGQGTDVECQISTSVILITDVECVEFYISFGLNRCRKLDISFNSSWCFAKFFLVFLYDSRVADTQNCCQRVYSIIFHNKAKQTSLHVTANAQMWKKWNFVIISKQLKAVKKSIQKNYFFLWFLQAGFSLYISVSLVSTSFIISNVMYFAGKNQRTCLIEG